MLTEYNIDNPKHKLCKSFDCRCGCHIKTIEKPKPILIPTFYLGDKVTRQFIMNGTITAIYCDIANYGAGLVFYPELYEVDFGEQGIKTGFFDFGLTHEKD